jgi:hypothetical protein
MKIIAASVFVSAFLLATPSARPDSTEYIATNVTEKWLTLSDEQDGFTLKYPPGWNTEQNPARVSIYGPNMAPEITIVCTRESADARIAKLNRELQGALRVDSAKIKLNRLEATRAHFTRGYFDDAGNEEMEVLYVSGNGSTYEILWTLGRGKMKNSPGAEAVCHELLGTLELVKANFTDLKSFTDQRTHLTFTYPAKWRVMTGGFPQVLVDDGPETRITFTIMEYPTVEAFLRERSYQVTELSEVTPYFAQDYNCRKCKWSGYESYLIEKNGHLLIVTVDRASASERASVDALLASLTLPAAFGP